MRRMLATLALATAITVGAPAMADEQTAPATVPEPTAAPAPATKPTLVVAIAVDQFSADLFAQYREHFTGGFTKLLSGAVFPSGYQSHAATETCPGHSTLLTGAHPSKTGIIANNWTVPGIGREDKSVYCAEDETDPESTSRKPVVSFNHLKVPTIGDRLKAINPASRNVAVSAKDRAAVMMSGHNADAAYWWLNGAFTTYKGRQFDAAAVAENEAVTKVIAAGKPAMEVPAWCAARDRAVPVKDFTIGTFRFPLKPGDARAFGRMPYMDAATGDFAIRLVDQYQLGKDAVPDVLSVSFSETDYVGHAYGTEGLEMCLQMAHLDATLGTFFDELDKRGLDYIAVLTADHGGFDAPERLVQQGYPSAVRLSADLSEEALSKAVSEETGVVPKSGTLLFVAGGSGDIWLADGLSKKQQKKVTTALIARLKAHPQVEGVFTAGELAKVPVPKGAPQDWTLIQKVRASFDPERSGQVLMMTKRGVMPGDPNPGYTATHGSPWDYDRRVPMLFWRKGLTGFEQPDPVETVDIAPTLAAILDIDVPAGEFDGRCLDIDGGTADICGK